MAVAFSIRQRARVEGLLLTVAESTKAPSVCADLAAQLARASPMAMQCLTGAKGETTLLAVHGLGAGGRAARRIATRARTHGVQIRRLRELSAIDVEAVGWGTRALVLCQEALGGLGLSCSAAWGNRDAFVALVARQDAVVIAARWSSVLGGSIASGMEPP